MDRNTATGRTQWSPLIDSFERFLQGKGKGRGGGRGDYRRNVERELERFVELSNEQEV
jgi:hypothetical protein